MGFYRFSPHGGGFGKYKAPEQLDGMSVLPTLLGQKQATNKRFLYWEFFEGGFQQAVRWDKWKFIRREKDELLELYNLDDDVGEENNLAATKSGIIAKFQEYLKTARTDSEDWPIE